MARRKKQAASNEGNGGIKPAEAGPGHNKPELTEDEQRVLLYQHKALYQAADKAVKDAQNALRTVAKKAKAECGKSAVADIKTLILLENAKGDEAMRADWERQLRLARWAGLDIGFQASFLDQAPPLTERAFAAGKTAGLKGERAKAPKEYLPGSPGYEFWMKGWHEGQAVLASQFWKKPENLDKPIAEVAGEDGEGLVMAEADFPDVSDPPFAAPADDLDIPPSLRRDPAPSQQA